MKSSASEEKAETEQQVQRDSNVDATRWNETPKLLIKGFLMGSADIVPGVSGGTLALILGIYSRLLHAIKSLNGQVFKKVLTFKFKQALEIFHWKFLAFLMTGILSAFLFFTKVVPLQVYMFTDPEIVYGLFFGLIAGSIYILIKELNTFGIYHGTALLAGIIIGFWVVTLVPTDTPESIFFVFLSGAIAVSAMILPGISGSYILLILRKYDYILSQVGKLGTPETVGGLLVLIPFILGAVFGLILFSRVLTWLLDRYYTITITVLIGFLIGSLYVIWPYQNRTFKKIVRKTQLLPVNDPRVQELKQQPESENRPEYHQLGEVHSSASNGNSSKIEYQTIKKKLIKSRPYIPFIASASTGHQSLSTWDFWRGIIGMAVGFAMVGLLDKLRDD